ncbi:hypothetical protein ABBQ38_012999 [Trebouxia sp. C0009 RCD-2024]
MAAVASVFPDLDLALAVSRVEVVSNVEIETIKTALRWLFDEAQSQRKAAETSDPSATHSQIDDLNKRIQQQTASVSALQEQQDKLLQSSQDAQQALKPLQALPEALAKLQERQDAAAGGQQQLSSLQQRLDTLSQGQAKLGLDIMALKANASPAPVSSLEANSGSQPEQQAANGGSSQTADSKSKVDTGSTADTGSAADSSTAGAYGNVQPNPALAGGIVIQRLDTLAAEVALLKAAMASAGSQQLPNSAPQAPNGTPQPSTSGSTAGGGDLAMLLASSGGADPSGAPAASLADEQDRQAPGHAWQIMCMLMHANLIANSKGEDHPAA